MNPDQRVDEIMKSFREVHKTFFQALLKAAQPRDLTPVQLWVLKVLAERPGISLSDLAEKILVGNSTTSGIIDRMEKAGYVTRERSEADRRSIQLRLTELGERMWAETNGERLSRLSAILSLPDEDLQQMIRIHGQIVQLLQQTREDTEERN
jgi:DNA-binding MarR family transcriptional regulator